MPYLASPTLTLTALSATSLRAAVAGDTGVTYRVYYRVIGGTSDTLADSVVGSGSVDVSGLAGSGSYQLFAVADDAVHFAYSLPTIAFLSLATAAADTPAAVITAKFYAAPALVAAVPGGLWTGEVPEGTVPPYAWLDLPKQTFAVGFETRWEPTQFTVHLYAPGAAATEAAAAAFRAVFNEDASLHFAAGSCVWLLPRSYVLRPEPYRYKDATLMFRAIISYDLLVERNRS